MIKLGKSNKWISKRSNIPFLIQIIYLGYSSIDKLLIDALTSSDFFHFAYWPKLFWLDQTEVWMIFKYNCPLWGLKIKTAPIDWFNW